MGDPDRVCPWTNVYGLARSVLALATLLTLAFNRTDLLFRPLGAAVSPARGSIGSFGLFSMASGADLSLAKGLAMGVLLLVVIGWRPRLTGLLHWWIAASFAAACVPVEGGDQVAAILSLLLVPVTLGDNRRWHWTSEGSSRSDAMTVGIAAVARSCFGVIRLQVAVIYFFACIAKFDVREWANGTAVYYWLVHPTFGLAEPFRPFVIPLLAWPGIVAVITWSVLALEALLFMGLAMDSRLRPRLLALGLLFHFAIIVAHGLFTFSLSMAAALILYLRPPEKPFRVARLVPWAIGRPLVGGGIVYSAAGEGGDSLIGDRVEA